MRTCTDSADYDKSGKKLSTALLQQGQREKTFLAAAYSMCSSISVCVESSQQCEICLRAAGQKHVLSWELSGLW